MFILHPERAKMGQNKRVYVTTKEKRNKYKSAHRKYKQTLYKKGLLIGGIK